MKIIKYILIIAIIGLVIIIYFCCAMNFYKIMSLVTGSYPAVGNYWISFNHNEEGNINARVYYLQYIYNEPVDLNNLELYIEPGVGYDIDKNDIYNDNKIRKKLLQSGLAKIIDESKATEEEISYQSKAIKEENGIWDTGDKKPPMSFHVVYGKLTTFISSNWWKIIKWIIFTGIGICTPYYLIKKIMSRKRIDSVLMGGVSSGKTSIVKRIQKPNITEGRLLAEATSTKAEEIVKCDRVAYKGKDIYPYLFDNRGDGYGEMIDAINKFGIKKSDNKVVIYVISFTQTYNSSEFDYKHSNSQISKAAVLVKSFKTSKSLKKVKKIILFFNKCDLLYDNEAEFIQNRLEIEKKYEEMTDYQELKDYADVIIFGSALKGWGIDELKDEMLRIS